VSSFQACVAWRDGSVEAYNLDLVAPLPMHLQFSIWFGRRLKKTLYYFLPIATCVQDINIRCERFKLFLFNEKCVPVGIHVNQPVPAASLDLAEFNCCKLRTMPLTRRFKVLSFKYSALVGAVTKRCASKDVAILGRLSGS